MYGLMSPNEIRVWMGLPEQEYITNQVNNLVQCNTCDVIWSIRFSKVCWTCDSADAILPTAIFDKYDSYED